MDLGDKIKAARAQKGLTQKELAQRAKLTERTIQRIENHEVEPSVYSLNKISEILEFDFLTEKLRIMKRRNQIIYTIMAVWTAALVFNLIFTDFNFADRWWEILIWGLTLSAVVTGQIYIPYRSKK
ncbi:MAG: helix-turn-helix transcriptional regulator [Flavobacteriales bacterium]|jgi:transcriptional regulator with XRE-family HTH domain|nr:helix-turn-helix transcriptional regulator [Flavobacteriales bacterium]MDP4877037.1 helix-turn-helix domain-containing protein [Schleiferiaceae bacterium]